MNLQQIKKITATAMLALFVLAGCEMATRDNPYDEKSSSYVRAIYVSTTAVNSSDSNNGSREAPLKTIQAGINKAVIQFGGEPAEVRVAAGTYSSDYYTSGTPVIEIVEGISVKGGYSVNFDDCDPVKNETTLQDTSTTGGVDYTTSNRVITIGSDITSATVLSGFIIETAGLGHSSGIYCANSTPTIAVTSIIGMSSMDSSGYIYGITCYNASPVIYDNKIFKEWSSNKAANSYAIYSTGSGTPVINGNELYGGRAVVTTGIYAGSSGTITGNSIYGNTTGIISGNTNSYGILVVSASPVINSNTSIDCGSGSDYAICIRINGTCNPVITSNRLSNANRITDYSYAIYEAASGADPSSVTGNDFDGFFCGGYTNTALYFDYGNSSPIILTFSANIENTTTSTLTIWGNASSFTSN